MSFWNALDGVLRGGGGGGGGHAGGAHAKGSVMDVLHANRAGLDVHEDTVVACSRRTAGGQAEREVRTFKTAASGLLELPAWLAERGCTDIVMEAAGVCWKPVWNIPGDGDFVLMLASAAHVKNVPLRGGAKKDGPKNRRQRRHVAGRSAGARTDPWQLCPGRPGPRAARPFAHAQADDT